MSCIITYKGQKYSEEQFKKYFINNKQEFVTFIAKNKDVIDSFKESLKTEVVNELKQGNKTDLDLNKLPFYKESLDKFNEEKPNKSFLKFYAEILQSEDSSNLDNEGNSRPLTYYEQIIKEKIPVEVTSFEYAPEKLTAVKIENLSVKDIDKVIAKWDLPFNVKKELISSMQYSLFEKIEDLGRTDILKKQWGAAEEYLKQQAKNRYNETKSSKIAGNYKSLLDNWEFAMIILKRELSLEKAKLNLEESVFDDPDAIAEKGESYDKSALEDNFKAKASVRVKTHLKNLYSNVISQETGTFTMIPFNQTWKILENNLTGLVPRFSTQTEYKTVEEMTLPDVMMAKLDELSAVYPHFDQLKRNLKKGPINDLIEFVHTFSKANNLFNAHINNLEIPGDVKTINADGRNQAMTIKSNAVVFLANNLFNKDGSIKQTDGSNSEEVSFTKVLKLFNNLKNRWDDMPENAKYSHIEIIYKNIGIQGVTKQVVDRYIHKIIGSREDALNGGVKTFQNVPGNTPEERGKRWDEFKEGIFRNNVQGFYYSLLTPIEATDTVGKFPLFNMTQFDAKNNPIKKNTFIINALTEIIAIDSNLPGESMVVANDKSYFKISQNNFVTKTLTIWKNQPEIMEEHFSKVYTRFSRFKKHLLGSKLEINLSILYGGKGEGYGDVLELDDFIHRVNKIVAHEDHMMNRNNEAIFPTMTPSDKSMMYELSGMPMFRTTDIDDAVNDLYDWYFLAELDRMIHGKADIETYKKNQMLFMWFPKLNGDSNVFEDGDITKPNIPYVKSKIKESFVAQMEKNKQMLINNKLTFVQKNGFLAPIKAVNTKVYTNAYPHGGGMEKLLRDVTFNSIVGNIEYTMLFSGDPAFYGMANLAKRAGMPTGTGGDLVYFVDKSDPVFKTYKVSITEDHEVQSEFLDSYREASVKKYSASLGVIEANLLAEKEIDPFLNINEGDAACHITPRRYRDIHRQEGAWPKARQEAYERLMNPNNTAEIGDLLMFTPIKGQHYEIIYKNGLAIPFTLKYSQFVLWPALVAGTNLENVYAKMVADDIDERVFISGVKFGASDVENSFDYLKGIGSGSYVELQNLYWKRQQATDSKFLEKGKTMQASQMEKVTLTNLDLDNDKYDGKTGREVSTELRELARTSTDRTLGILKNKWFTNGTLDKEKVISKVLDYLEEEGDKIPSNVKDALLLGSSIDATNMSEKLEQVLMSALNKAGTKMDMPGGALVQVSSYGFEKTEGVDLTQLNKIGGIRYLVDIDYLKGPHLDKNGLVNAQVMIPHGVIKTLKSKHAKSIFDMYASKEDKAELIKLIEENNKVAIQTLYNKVVDQLTGKQLSGILGKSLEGIIGYRIPTQNMSSIDVLDVVGILPDTAGDSIVVYREMTAKTGADFDIDKMYVMMHNLVFDRKTKTFSKVKYLDERTSVEERHRVFYMEELLKSAARSVRVTREQAVAENKEIQAELNELKDEREELKDRLKKRGVKFSTSKELILMNGKINDKYSHFNDINGLVVETVEEVYQEKLDSGEFLSLEDFAMLPITDQNTMKAVQNRKLELYNSVLRNSYELLLSALDSKELRFNAYYIEILRRFGWEIAQSFKEKSDKEKDNFIKNEVSALENLEAASLLYQQKIKFNNRLGKSGTGMTSDHLTNISYSQQFGVSLAISFNYPGMEKGIDISKKLDDKNRYISDSVSSTLNANVDAAKDTYISFINSNTETSNIKFALMRGGANMEWVNAFLSQPIIADYITDKISRKGKIAKHFRKAITLSGPKLEVDSLGNVIVIQPKKKETHFVTAREEFLSNYIAGWEDIQFVAYEHLTTEQLEREIASGGTRETQLAIFKEFLKAEAAGEALGEFIKLTKSDVKGATNSLLEASRLQKARVTMIEKGIVVNADKVFTESNQAVFNKNSAEFALNNLSKVLISGTNGAISNVDAIIESSKLMNIQKNRTAVLREYKKYLATANEAFSFSEEDKKYLGGQFINDLKDYIADWKSPKLMKNLVEFKKTTINDGFESNTYQFLVTSFAEVDADLMKDITSTWEKELASNREIVKDNVSIGVTAGQLMESLIKYSFLASGFQAGKFNLHKYIPASYLNKLGYYVTSNLVLNYLQNQGVDVAFIEQWAVNNIEDVPYFKIHTDMGVKFNENSVVVPEALNPPYMFKQGNRVYMQKGESDFGLIYMKLPSYFNGEDPRGFINYKFNERLIKNVNVTEKFTRVKLNQINTPVFTKTSEGYNIEGTNIKLIATATETSTDEGPITLYEVKVTNKDKTLSLNNGEYFATEQEAFFAAMNRLYTTSVEIIEKTLNNCKI